MTLLHVVSRGIRYRPGRSVVVLALAAVATAAAVMTPAYTSAAHQSLLTDALTDLPNGADHVRLAAQSHNAEAETGYFDEIHEDVERRVAADAELAPLVDPVRYAWTKVSVADGDWPALSQVMYRDGLCKQLRVVKGDCRTGENEVLISKRSARFEDVTIGDTLSVGVREDDAESTEVTIAGIYEPRDAAAGYWGLDDPFKHGIGANTNNLDALFMTKPRWTADVKRPVEIGVEYAIDIPAVRLASAEPLRDRLDGLKDSGEFAGHAATAESRLAGLLKEVTTGQNAVSAAVPVVTIPLLLLSWFVLYLVVARLSEERAPQIALAKLRGHRFAAVTGFGTGEAALLVVAGVPVGTLLGWLLVQIVAWIALAPGAEVALTADIAVYAVIALMGAWAAALAAARTVLTRPVLALLRRVPAQRGWRAGLVEGAVVALAAVAVWQVFDDPDAGAFGLLATPLVALVLGAAAARLLELVARHRLPVAIRRAKVARMLALAQVARRPETRRMVVLVTVAAAVVTFGVSAWDVSQHNRELTADDQIGADAVYTLSGGDPKSVMDAVERLDPDGDQLMAAMRRVDRFDNKDYTTVAVQSDRLAAVARWRGMTPGQLAGLAKRLHPKLPEPLRVKGEIGVKAMVPDIEAERKPSLVARVVPDGADPVTLRLGTMSEGTRTYTANAPECEEGCRLIGVGISRHPGDFDAIAVAATVTRIFDADGSLDASLADCRSWRPAAKLPDAVRLKLGCEDGLSISATGDQSVDFIAEYAASPRALPVAVAGPIPSSDVKGDKFASMGPQRALQRYQRAETVTVVPRGGVRAMVVDLEYTDLAAQDHLALKDQDEITFEIWATEAAGSGLAKRLADAGLVVAATESREQVLDRMSRAAPALGLRLYLVAAGLALLLVIGAVLLTSTVGAAVRGYDNAALAVAGVSRSRLRAASIREHLYWIVVPAAAGIGAGLAGLALVLPTVPLVGLEPSEVATVYEPRPLLPGVALLLMAAAFAAVVWLAVRLGRRNGSIRRLRDSD